MYLCRSPVIAGNLWSDIMGARQLNLPITGDVLKRLADKNECRLILSTNLKPIDFVAGALLITDGSSKGWAEPHLYILYINGTNAKNSSP